MTYVRLMRDEGEEHLAELNSALSIGLRVPDADLSEAADAPHVGACEPVPEAGTLPVEPGEPGQIHPPQAASKGPPVDEG